MFFIFYQVNFYFPHIHRLNMNGGMLMNIDKWSEMYYQPKLTYILKNLDTSSFDELGMTFKEILGYPIEVYVNKSEKERWTVAFIGHGTGSTIKLNIALFDPSSKIFEGNLDIKKPTVEIVHFIMQPQGQGLGSKVIRELISFIEASQWGFELMILMAQDRKAASFWEKVGFKEVNDSLSMTLSLVKNIKENNVPIKVKVKVQLSSKQERIVINEYNI
jgi:hypothetical protein